MSDIEDMDLRWRRYLIKGLEPFSNNQFFIRELTKSKDEIETKKKALMKDGQTERMALSSIALDLWMYQFIDWKVPEYYRLCITDYIDKGDYNYELIDSPIHLIVGRNGLVLPQKSKIYRYTAEHRKLKSAFDTSVYVQIDKGTKAKDIKKFTEIYFDFIEANNNIIMQDRPGVRDTHPDLDVLEVIYRCIDKGITNHIEIANVLDEEYPKKGDKVWTADAVRLRLEAINKIHDKNVYAKADYYAWLEDQEDR